MSPSDLAAQVAPGSWLYFEFTPANTKLHVRIDSVTRRISDSLKLVRDDLAGRPRARYYFDDCLRITRLGNAADSAFHLRIADTCRGTADTIFVGSGTLTNGSIALVAPADSTIMFRYSRGRQMWAMRIDTISIAGYPVKYDTSYVRAFAPDTIQFLTKPVHWDDIIGKPLSATYFFHEDTSDLAGYNYLRPVPADHPEHVHNLAVSSGPPTLFHQFATDSVTSPIFIPAGKWIVHIYGYVDNAAGGSYIWTEVLHRTSNGTETSLFTLSTPTLTTSLARHEMTYYGGQQVMNTGDRILARVYAYSTSVPSRTVTFVMEGDTAASHIHFPAIYEGEPVTPPCTDSTFLQLRDTPDSYVGQSGKLVAVKATEDGLEFIDAGAATRQIIGYSNYLGTPLDRTADYVWLVGLGGVIVGHQYNGPSQDTISYLFSLDWDWIKDSVMIWTASSSTFLGLTDTPSSYTGNAGKVVKVNPSADALIFADDETGGGGGGITVVMDSTNYVASDSAYYWYFREMKPQKSMNPSAGGDSLVTKNRIGWKEWEVVWFQVRNNVTTGHLDFDIRSDSLNDVAILMWEANGTSVRTSTSSPPYISDATANWQVIWRPNLMATASGTTRSGGSPAGPSTLTTIAAPNSNVRADGYAPIYWANALMQQSNSGTTAHFFRLRVYYVTPVNTSSSWYVQIENL
ncbi:MAG: hypothetical protein M5R41_10300 [Bacteroidia bacterium]|nr:hypothetical protein [Bacteroidia bacterium]